MSPLISYYILIYSTLWRDFTRNRKVLKNDDSSYFGMPTVLVLTILPVLACQLLCTCNCSLNNPPCLLVSVLGHDDDGIVRPRTVGV